MFLCSGVQIAESDSRRDNRHIIELDSLGENPNVFIRLEKLANVFNKTFAPRLVDLLEIASYVFAADSSTERGEGFTDKSSVEKWGRDFHFIIPVRDLSFWESKEVVRLLRKIIEFCSNDQADFDFVELTKERITDEYLDFGEFEEWELHGIERVTMFSGGLDSLAGIIDEAKSNEPLMLVSHSPVNSTQSRQTELSSQLKLKFSNKIQHIPAVINKDRRLGNEFLQRTRSFLFSSIGTIIAETIQANGVRFYENGVVSLNLPVADEVLRARASRTTHPQTLKFYSELFSLVTGRPFNVDNPYLFKTKADIVGIIKSTHPDLIKHSCSCAHTGFFQSKSQWHCGTCSQCIDRRVAILATNAEEYDPITDYKNDVFKGPRKDGQEKNIAIGFVRHALELKHMSENEIATKFNTELARAVRYLPKKSEATRDLIDMHKRHSEAVFDVLSKQLAENSGDLISNKLDPSSMLSLMAGGEHSKSSWTKFADKIIDLLENGVPKTCATIKPVNENHLQEICDGILQANENILIREFPFMRWSSGSTKPDWSNEEIGLWVEAKYVRRKAELGQIREAIAADITKYGDNNRKVLFLIYDPQHRIVNEAEFGEPITRREDMRIHFLR